MNWPTKKLGEVIEISYGKGLPKDSRVDSGKYFAYGSNGPVYSTDESLTNGETIVIGRKGTAGALYFISDPCWPIDTTFFAKPKNDASLKFVYYFLRTKRLPKLAIVTGVPGINRTTLANIDVQLPPLGTQKQIVERLDKIAEAQKLNDGLIQKTDELFQSLLHKELNPAGKDWEVEKLGLVFNRITDAILPTKHPEQKFNFIGLENIESNTSRLVNISPVQGKFIKSTKTRFKIGDVLYGKLRPYLNKVWLADFDGICSTDIWALRAKEGIILPQLLGAILQQSSIVQKSSASMAGANLPRANKDIFDKIAIALPPLEIQKQIVAKLSAVQDYKKQLLEQKAKLKELFDSALTRSMKS